MNRLLLHSGLVAVSVAAATAPAAAQIPTEYTNLQVLPEDITRGELLGYMRGFSLGTGFRCNHCHVAEDPTDFSTFDFASDDLREKRVAREMFRMIMHINGEILPSVPDRGEPAIEVGCVTCHAGKPRPTTLEQEMIWAHADSGADALEAKYAELREQYFGLGAFNFGPLALDNVAQQLAEDDSEAALKAVEINLEYHPESVSTWNVKGSIHMRLEQREEAIAAFERSMEIQPNPPAQRALRQLRGGG